MGFCRSGCTLPGAANILRRNLRRTRLQDRDLPIHREEPKEACRGNLSRRSLLKALSAAPLAALVPVLDAKGAARAVSVKKWQKPRLTLIPPSLITDKINLDMRGAVPNMSPRARDYTISIYLDKESPSTLLYTKKERIPAYSSVGIDYRHPTAGLSGRHSVILAVEGGGEKLKTEREFEVVKSNYRSTRTIGGAWVDIVHWSNAEARYYNAALRKLTSSDWRQQIRGMHGIGMNIAVVQEVFLNNEYYGKNNIAKTGYHGKAFYPSALFPGRAQIACHDPLEAILSEADRLQMSVFLGVGMYAWFDYSAVSLAWHKKVAVELWSRYGQHPSFYGWYVSEEVDGGLSIGLKGKAKEQYRREIVAFFKGFRKFCRAISPEKPVMLAPNTFGLRQAREVWPHVLEHVDIICPFGFGRMPHGDFTGSEAQAVWQTMCRQSGTHLWMDMESFVFQGRALVPAPIGAIKQELHRFTDFEEIICYEYSGIMNSPGASIKPGGPRTVVLYREYQQYLQSLGLNTIKQSG